MQTLRNKTLVLTGASLGIGRALAVALAKRGVHLLLNARTEPLLRDLATECRMQGVQAEYVAGNAASSKTARRLVEAALAMAAEPANDGKTKNQGLYGFIHAAGVLHPGPALWELSKTSFNEVMEASVTAAFQLVRHTVPHLLLRNKGRGEGLAVFFGSGAANRAQPGIAAYCAAKAAEEHLMRNLAAEAPQVTTFAYQPGVVETRMQIEARQSTGEMSDQVQAVFKPWKEEGVLLTPEEAAEGLLAFLEGDVRKYHGRVVRVGQTEPVG